MNKLSKILIAVIAALVVLLIIVTYKYFKQRDLIYENMGNYNFSVNYSTNNDVK